MVRLLPDFIREQNRIIGMGGKEVVHLLPRFYRGMSAKQRTRPVSREENIACTLYLLHRFESGTDIRDRFLLA